MYPISSNSPSNFLCLLLGKGGIPTSFNRSFGSLYTPVEDIFLGSITIDTKVTRDEIVIHNETLSRKELKNLLFNDDDRREGGLVM